MKINVTVDLEDLYEEYYEGDSSGESFNQQILSEIKHQVKQSIWKEFKDTTLDHFRAQINDELEKEKDGEITRIVQKVFSERKIKIKEGTKNNPEPEMITLFEYIQEKIEKDYFSMGMTAETLLSGKFRELQNSVEKSVSTSAELMSSEIKQRYDLLFASQLVAKMNQAGMLKDDVAKLLIDQNNQTNEG
jgi:hypothetical protein